MAVLGFQFGGIVQKALQKSVNGETLLQGFRRQAGFSFRRDVETHMALLPFLARIAGVGARDDSRPSEGSAIP